MAFKNIFLAALLAASAIAAPTSSAPSTEIVGAPAINVDIEDRDLTKRYKTGWCTFDVHSDVSNGLAGKKSTYKLALKLYDADRSLISEIPQRVQKGGVDVYSPLPYVLNFNGEGISSGGWEMKYGAQSWNSDDAKHCVGFTHKFPGIGNGYRHEFDWHCGFTC